MKIFRMDWKRPDYSSIIKLRLDNIDHLRSHPEQLPEYAAYYRDHEADFINDFGVTYDPRNIEIGLPAIVPFVLFDKQREWIDFVKKKWIDRRPGICEKSRDMGISWLAMALACTMCLFRDNMAIGFGSRVEDLVDKSGTMKPLLPKGRMFLENLPAEFIGDWLAWRDAPYMRINFPKTGSYIAGEAGAEIGRGDRTSIYFFDEAAHHPRATLVEAALSQTANCRIDMSSVRGMQNPFAQKRWAGKVEVFIFDWHDDPRKDDEWYKKQCQDLDPVVVAQEIDRDYQASVSGAVIPAQWAKACLGAREKLGIARTGRKTFALDIADEGDDKIAACEVDGIEVVGVPQWSGKGSDLFATCERAFEMCDEKGYRGFRYDGDGIGASVRGDARILNERRAQAGRRPLIVQSWRGSDAVVDPEGVVEGTLGDSPEDAGRQNQDFYQNRKAQGWWDLRNRCKRTHRWVVDGVRCDPDEILSIDPKGEGAQQLVAELSQPTYTTNGAGKIVINKKPDGMPSPNRGDACMMRFARGDKPPVQITGMVLSQIAAAGRRR